MINIMVIILCIGILSAVFGLLLLFAPSLILKAEVKANRLYMTDTALLKNRIPLGISMIGAAVFLGYSYASNEFKEIIFLIISITAGVFGLLLLFSPNSILIAERKANKLYMTDAFFIENRIMLGAGLLLASLYMIYTYLTFS